MAHPASSNTHESYEHHGACGTPPALRARDPQDGTYQPREATWDLEHILHLHELYMGHLSTSEPLSSYCVHKIKRAG